MSKRKWAVTVPIAGSVYVEFESESSDPDDLMVEAIDVFNADQETEQPEWSADWTWYPKLSSGNTLHVSGTTEVEVDDLGPAEPEDEREAER